MRQIRKVKRQGAISETAQREEKTPVRTQSKENTENPISTDWAAIWKQHHGNPIQRLIIKDDDEWMISKPQEERGQKRTPTNDKGVNSQNKDITLL